MQRLEANHRAGGTDSGQRRNTARGMRFAGRSPNSAPRSRHISTPPITEMISRGASTAPKFRGAARVAAHSRESAPGRRWPLIWVVTKRRNGVRAAAVAHTQSS